MTVAEKLGQLSQIKTDIRNAIVAKGVTLDESAPFNEYAPAIQTIEQTIGGGGGTEFLNSSKQEIIIPQASWEQSTDGFYTSTIEVPGVFADERLQEIFITSLSEYRKAYDLAGVSAVSQAKDAIVFKADLLPEQDFIVYVTIVNPVEISTELVSWFPKMSSNNTPTSYRVYPENSSSAYHVFDDDTTAYFSNSYWVTFGFSKPYVVYGIDYFLSATVSAQSHLVLDFSVFGSMDNSNWDMLGSFDVSDSNRGEFARCMFKTPVKYRFYKFQSNGSTIERFYEIRFIRPSDLA